MKKAYYTFEFKNREITLCAISKEYNPNGFLKGFTEVQVGYSVCVPQDDFDEKISRKISLGRADSESRIYDHAMKVEIVHYPLLKAICKIISHKIMDGELTIKGIRKRKKNESRISK